MQKIVMQQPRTFLHFFKDLQETLQTKYKAKLSTAGARALCVCASLTECKSDCVSASLPLDNVPFQCWPPGENMAQLKSKQEVSPSTLRALATN